MLLYRARLSFSCTRIDLISFGAPSIGSAYAELSKLLSTTIPAGSHPTPAITKMLSHFTYLKDAGFDFPAPVQTMIILCKLPPTMEVVAQILSQTSPDEIKNLKPEGIVKAARLSFEQKGATRGGGKGPQANKLSALKRKLADPKFAQQQQQQGGSNGGASRNAPAQGQGGRTRRGGKKAHTRRENAQQAAFATYVHYDGPEPTVDPRALAHTPGAAHYGPLHLIIPLRPSTWHTTWGWNPPAKPSAPSTISCQRLVQAWTSPRPVPPR